VLIENVPAVVHDRRGVVRAAMDSLERSGFSVAQRVLELVNLEVAQTRRRHVLLAVRGSEVVGDLDKLLAPGVGPNRSLKWAIGDLADSDFETVLDTPSRPSPTNLARMLYLLETGEFDLPNRLRPNCHRGDHSYVSMYGRLRWDFPAQTITSGFGSIGQGRYMHPDKPRALTPHEAARIQGFPDYFDFSATRTRTELAVIIGNAVPPQLAETLVGRLIANGLA